MNREFGLKSLFLVCQDPKKLGLPTCKVGIANFILICSIITNYDNKLGSSTCLSTKGLFGTDSFMSCFLPNTYFQNTSS